MYEIVCMRGNNGGARILKLGIPASKQNARLIIMEATHVLGS